MQKAQTSTRPSRDAIARALAEKTSDAYSYDRYRNWQSVIKALLIRGYTEREVEAIVRSKWMRWAGDRIEDGKSIRYGNIPARAILEFIDEMVKQSGEERVKREVAELVAGTFNGEENN